MQSLDTEKASGPWKCEWVTAKKKKLLTCGCCEGIKEGAGGLTMSEEGEENPPPQQFWRPSCYELTKTPRLWPEVVSARRGVPEHSPCNKSDLAILLGQTEVRVTAATALLSSSIAHPSEHKLPNLPTFAKKYRLECVL